MAKLATLAVGVTLGAVLGVVGVFATVGALSPSADHVAEQTSTDPAATVYGAR